MEGGLNTSDNTEINIFTKITVTIIKNDNSRNKASAPRLSTNSWLGNCPAIRINICVNAEA